MTRSKIHPELIQDFEKENGHYDYDWEFRCPTCDLACASKTGVKIHMSRMHKPEPEQNFEGRLADVVVKRQKVKTQQSARPVVKCGDLPLDNVASFKYLGSLFTVDADQHQDIKSRIAMAMTRCGKLRHILTSDKIHKRLKLRLYEAAVCSLLTFGSETWDLNPKACRQINGANSRMLAWFTGKTIPQEARPATTSCNLIRKIRMTRLRWVGHILRAGPDYLPFQALKAQVSLNCPGNLLMDTPPHHCIEDLVPLVKDRAYWRALVRAVPTTV